MFGGFVDIAVGFVAGYVVALYGWTYLKNKVAEKFAAVVKAAAEKQ